jgi:hypothetical protein
MTKQIRMTEQNEIHESHEAVEVERDIHRIECEYFGRKIDVEENEKFPSPIRVSILDFVVPARIG